MLGFLEGLPIQYYTPSRRPSWYREHCSHWVMEFIIRDHWNQGSTYQNQLVLEPCCTKTFSNPSTAPHQRIFETKKIRKISHQLTPTGARKQWDKNKESQDGNKKFGNPGRRGRRRPAEACLCLNLVHPSNIFTDPWLRRVDLNWIKVYLMLFDFC